MKKQFLITLALTALAYSTIAQRPHPAAMNSEERNQWRQQDIDEAAGYGTNFIRFVPIRFMDIFGIGMGVDYEKLVDKDRKIAIVLPFTYMFETLTISAPNGVVDSTAYYYFSPGIKFYPFGQRKVTYAFGPNFVFGFGSGTVDGSYWDNGNYITRDRNFTNTRFSLLINNYLNVQFTSQFCFGVELGLGARYVNLWKYEYGEDDRLDILPTGNFALSFGYRF